MTIVFKIPGACSGSSGGCFVVTAFGSTIASLPQEAGSYLYSISVMVSVGNKSMQTAWKPPSVSPRCFLSRKVRSLRLLGSFRPLILVRHDLEFSMRMVALGWSRQPRRRIKAGMMGRLAQMMPVASSAELELISHI